MATHQGDALLALHRQDAGMDDLTRLLEAAEQAAADALVLCALHQHEPAAQAMRLHADEVLRRVAYWRAIAASQPLANESGNRDGVALASFRSGSEGVGICTRAG